MLNGEQIVTHDRTTAMVTLPRPIILKKRSGVANCRLREAASERSENEYV